MDSDTLDVRLNDRTECLRLIGMDTSETVDLRKEAQCFGRETLIREKELLTGQNIHFEATHRGTSATSVAARRQAVQPRTAQGFADKYTYEVPYRYQAVFKEAEQQARASGQGFWSPATCNGNTEQPAGSPQPSVPPAPQPPVAPPPPPTPTTAPRQGSCDPSYPDVCIPTPPPDLDCGDVPYRNFRVVGSDSHRFDRDRDGVGGEG